MNLFGEDGDGECVCELAYFQLLASVLLASLASVLHLAFFFLS